MIAPSPAKDAPEPAGLAASLGALTEPPSESTLEPRVEPIVEPVVEPIVDYAVAPITEASQAPAVEPPVSASVAPPIAPAAPPVAPAAQKTCSNCGAATPTEDLFCGDCGAPFSGLAAAPAATIQAPVFAMMPGLAAQAGPTPASFPPHTGVDDYLSFRALWVTTHAAALFWIAEGANLVYWILDWAVSKRWSGAQGFFLSAVGFVLFAVIIRIVVEAAVAASRAGGGESTRN